MAAPPLDSPQAQPLSQSVCLEGERLATLVPISSYYEPAPGAVSSAKEYLLSRFAYARREWDELLLESPLSHARIHLHDRRAAALIHLLSRPQRVEALGGAIPELPFTATQDLMTLLYSARMVAELNDQGVPGDEEPPSLRSWEFHDLLFHARSRMGRHDQPVGGTYRFTGQLDPPPVLPPKAAGAVIELHRPDLDRLERDDPPFAQVQEARRSIREYADTPIAAEQLGEFLYRVGRVADFWTGPVPTPQGSLQMEYAPRPYPAGGALYELELYAVIHRCEGLATGLYQYDPEAHRLVQRTGRTADVEQLLRDAGAATGIPPERLQVLLVIGARFQRLAWKYASIAYSLTLKHVGVVYQTMYLTATAMGLAPCGVGCGNADLFARAAGTDYYAETSVGEFLLGSKG